MSYSAEVLADSPSVYWRLGEASGTVAADSSGNSRAGTYTNSPTLGSTGALIGDSNTAMTLTADSGQRVTIADAAWAHTSTMSVEAWVKFSSAFDSSNGDAIVSKYAAGGFQFLLHRSTTNHLAVEFANTAVSPFATADTGSPSLGVWYHVVATLDGSFIRLYVNGYITGTTAAFTGTLATGGTNPIEVGRRSAADTTTPGATIDEVAIYYGTVLSPDRILAHYAVGSGSVTGSGSLSLSASAGSASAAGSGSLSLSGSGATKAVAAGSGSLTLSAANTSARTGSGALSLSGAGAAASVVVGSGSLSLTGAAANGAGAGGFLDLSAAGTAEALYLTDTSNLLNGRVRGASATSTVTRPVGVTPSRAAVKYDKSVPLPPPTLVNGRPT